MASHGIKDKVAIVGMGCTRFGERWDCSADDLLVDATEECFASTPSIAKEDVDAYWLGTLSSGQSGLVLSQPLGIDYKPVSRVENYCATGSEAFRNACYAVACGAYDVVMAVGVEKLKDSGYSGLVTSGRAAGGGTVPSATQTAPAVFSLLDPYIFRLVIDRYATRFHDYTISQFIRGVITLLGAARSGVSLGADAGLERLLARADATMQEWDFGGLAAFGARVHCADIDLERAAGTAASSPIRRWVLACARARSSAFFARTAAMRSAMGTSRRAPARAP